AGSDKFTGIALGEGVNGTGYTFGELAPASLAGTAYVDANNNGAQDAGEAGIAGVTVKLTGTDDLGHAVSLTTTTDSGGSYSFTNLRPATYTVTETPPAGYFDGKETVGSLGGTAGTEKFTGVVVGSGASGTGYNFGELAPASLAGFV